VLPSPLGRGWPATALSPAGAGRVRGQLHAEDGSERLGANCSIHTSNASSFWRARRAFRGAIRMERECSCLLRSASSPAAKRKLTTQRTESTEKSTSARASGDYKVTVSCLLTHSLLLHLFSVTSVVPQARDEILLGLRPKAAL